MARPFDVTKIEKKWQDRWLEDGTYEVDNDDQRERYYALCMYPYPSGSAHQGHVRIYTFGDVNVRYRTMLGKAVLSPFGFDSFGLPAENAAIKAGTHPRIFTEARIVELKSSLLRLGAVYDWRREVRSHDPEIIRWSQTIFLAFLKAGLAYRAEALVNWCPGCGTVLANEQVLADGTCERSGDLVERRNLEQWFFKITDYAEELLNELDNLEWPERVKTMQRNWIGRSEGVEFDLAFAGDPSKAIRVFTTRPDTGFGVTYAVVAPEHPLLDELTTDEQRADVTELVERATKESEIVRTASSEGGAALEKRGAFTGSYVINPFNGESVPVYVADYVLGTYGTGAIMAVPGEDERDYAFAAGLRTAGRAHDASARRIRRRRLHRRRREDQLRLPGRTRRRRGEDARDGVPRRARERRGQGQLPTSRLVDLAPALLGLSDSDHLLPERRHRSGARRPVAGPRAR